MFEVIAVVFLVGALFSLFLCVVGLLVIELDVALTSVLLFSVLMIFSGIAATVDKKARNMDGTLVEFSKQEKCLLVEKGLGEFELNRATGEVEFHLLDKSK